MGSVSLSEKGFLSHYVKELSKIISPSKVPAGAKLKHLSQIPGRSKTPVKSGYLLTVVYVTFIKIHSHAVQAINYSLHILIMFLDGTQEYRVF